MQTFEQTIDRELITLDIKPVEEFIPLPGCGRRWNLDGGTYAKCDGYGNLLYHEESGKVFMAQECRCRKERKRRRLLFSLNIPVSHRHCLFENFHTETDTEKQIVENLISFSKKPPARGLLLSGNVGCGKTHLAVCVLRELVSHIGEGYFQNVPLLIKDLRETYEKKLNTESDLLGHLEAVEYLLLDDLGAETENEWAGKRLFEIIESRYEYKKITIITTNLTSTQMEKHNNRILSRLVEMCRVIKIEGKDHRKSFLKQEEAW